MKVPYVMVRWKDSQAGHGWKSRKEAEEWANAPGEEQLSIGFMLPIGPKESVVLATSMQLARGGEVGELLQIPRTCIKSLKKLGGVDDPS